MDPQTTALLLLGHGTRDPEGLREFRATVDLVRSRGRFPRVGAGFLELAEPSIPGAIRECVDAGARTLLALPLFLFAASHVKEDIPRLLEEARRSHPGVDIRFGRPLGPHPRILETLQDRLASAEAHLPPTSTRRGVLVVGRGSLDREANRGMRQVGVSVARTGRFDAVEHCFQEAAHPDIPEGLEALRTREVDSIVVLPYILFTGVVIRKIGETVAQWGKSHPGIATTMGHHLGADPRLADVVLERAGELSGRSHAEPAAAWDGRRPQR